MNTVHSTFLRWILLPALSYAFFALLVDPKKFVLHFDYSGWEFLLKWCILQWHWAAFIHGVFCMHLKIYPVIYLPSIFVSLSQAPLSSGYFNYAKKLIRNQKGFLFVLVILWLTFHFLCCSFSINLGRFFNCGITSRMLKVKARYSAFFSPN